MLNNTQKNQIITILKRLDPYKVVLFGSYAKDNENPDSDLDLYVIMKEDYIPATYKEKIKLKCRVSEVLDPLRFLYPIDLIVHTLPMYEKFKELDSTFFRDILHHGVVLYEADHV